MNAFRPTSLFLGWVGGGWGGGHSVFVVPLTTQRKGTDTAGSGIVMPRQPYRITISIRTLGKTRQTKPRSLSVASFLFVTMNTPKWTLITASSSSVPPFVSVRAGALSILTNLSGEEQPSTSLCLNTAHVRLHVHFLQTQQNKTRTELLIAI